jgi:hypothetical protein
MAAPHPPVDVAGVRTCTRCDVPRPLLDEFRKIGRARWHRWCRACESETAGQRQARSAERRRNEP